MTNGKTMFIRMNAQNKETTLIRSLPNSDIEDVNLYEELSIIACFYPKDYIVEINLDAAQLGLSVDQQDSVLAYIRQNTLSPLTYELAKASLGNDDDLMKEAIEQMLHPEPNEILQGA